MNQHLMNIKVESYHTRPVRVDGETEEIKISVANNWYQ